MSYQNVLNSLGLVFDGFGACLLLFYGFPQKEYEEIVDGQSFLMADVPPNPAVKEHNEYMRKLKSNHTMKARIALYFMIAGFFLQLFSNL